MDDYIKKKILRELHGIFLTFDYKYNKLIEKLLSENDITTEKNIVKTKKINANSKIFDISGNNYRIFTDFIRYTNNKVETNKIELMYDFIINIRDREIPIYKLLSYIYCFIYEISIYIEDTVEKDKILDISNFTFHNYEKISNFANNIYKLIGIGEFIIVDKEYYISYFIKLYTILHEQKIREYINNYIIYIDHEYIDLFNETIKKLCSFIQNQKKQLNINYADEKNILLTYEQINFIPIISESYNFIPAILQMIYAITPIRNKTTSLFNIQQKENKTITTNLNQYISQILFYMCHSPADKLIINKNNGFLSHFKQTQNIDKIIFLESILKYIINTNNLSTIIDDVYIIDNTLINQINTIDKINIELADIINSNVNVKYKDYLVVCLNNTAQTHKNIYINMTFVNNENKKYNLIGLITMENNKYIYYHIIDIDTIVAVNEFVKKYHNAPAFIESISNNGIFYLYANIDKHIEHVRLFYIKYNAIPNSFFHYPKLLEDGHIDDNLPISQDIFKLEEINNEITGMKSIYNPQIHLKHIFILITKYQNLLNDPNKYNKKRLNKKYNKLVDIYKLYVKALRQKIDFLKFIRESGMRYTINPRKNHMKNKSNSIKAIEKNSQLLQEYEDFLNRYSINITKMINYQNIYYDLQEIYIELIGLFNNYILLHDTQKNTEYKQFLITLNPQNKDLNKKIEYIQSRIDNIIEELSKTKNDNLYKLYIIFNKLNELRNHINNIEYIKKEIAFINKQQINIYLHNKSYLMDIVNIIQFFGKTIKYYKMYLKIQRAYTISNFELIDHNTYIDLLNLMNDISENYIKFIRGPESIEADMPVYLLMIRKYKSSNSTLIKKYITLVKVFMTHLYLLLTNILNREKDIVIHIKKNTQQNINLKKKHLIDIIDYFITHYKKNNMNTLNINFKNTKKKTNRVMSSNV